MLLGFLVLGEAWALLRADCLLFADAYPWVLDRWGHICDPGVQRGGARMCSGQVFFVRQLFVGCLVCSAKQCLAFDRHWL